MTTRRTLLAGAAAAVWPIRAQRAAARPNIVLVMADDQGWGDTGYSGHPVVKTPNLDAMSRRGVRFDRFYSGAPVCSPTRGSCLTGRHPFRYGIYFANAGRPGQASEYAMPQGEVTIAQILQRNGYETGHFGKWHLGDFDGPKKYSPTDGGFNDWFSTTRKVATLDPPSSEYWENGREVERPLRGDDSGIIVDRALEFIRKAESRKKPYLAVIWMHAPHLPVVASEDDRKQYSAFSEAEQHYWGSITAMDRQVGRLREAVLGAGQDTMLWYTSDNGPEGDQRDKEWPGSSGPLRGRKASLFEGGVRVPGMLEWPKALPKHRVISATSSTSDYLPTILDALDLQPPDRRPLDGVSLMPVLRGSVAERSRPLAFETTRITRGSPRLALIDGSYKLLTNLDDSPDLLFDLKADQAERNNIAAQDAQRCEAMRGELTRWRASCKRSNAGLDYGRPV
jgi:arylsulfatase A-like enzyme